ncbi:MAG: mandelate racemase/muconate lactonizing enzyme family protein [Thermoprotei archaeon]|nr:mandelate racemase/muconate lactonizing enzyme family protein [Thermoprotei archaeon]
MSVIKEVEVIPLRIPFVRPFKLSRGYVGRPGQPGEHIYVKLVTSDGEVGWGEARPMHTWMYETMESVYTSIKRYLAPILIGKEPYDLSRIHEEMDKVLTPVVSSGQPFAKSAVDIALHDLIGKLVGLPLHRLIGGKTRDYVEMSALISGDPESISEYAREMLRKGFRCFKLKIMGDVDEDCKCIRALRDSIGDGGQIWLDANQAYSSLRLAWLLKEIKDVGNIICIEQPVPTTDFHGLRRIARMSPIPIAVDESLFSHYDLLKLITMEALDALVLKVAKSGIRNSLKIYYLAEAGGIDCLGSGMTESGVGFTASIHLYSVVKMVAPVDTNGPQFLSDLLVRGIEIEGPRVKVPDKPGLGIKVDESKIEEYRVTLEI